MILRDLHVHTTYCDGKDTAEDIVKQAIKIGLKTIGFSGHSYTDFDQSYCMSIEGTKAYIKEINGLKDKYNCQIEVLCGIEQDYFATINKKDFDFSIGSVHYICVDGKYYPIDFRQDNVVAIINQLFDGNALKFVEVYFSQVAKVLEKTNADIIGHFDLISKYNQILHLFDENSDEYRALWQKAIDALIPYNKPFEINTGAIARGYRTTAYPNYEMLKYIYQKGGKVILSSDSHKKENLTFEFDKYEKIAKEIGFEL